MRQDWVLMVGRVVLRLVLWLNWVSLAVFVAGLVLSVPFAGAIEARLVLKYGARVEASQVVWAMRILGVLGLAAIAIAWVIITQLLAMIDTVAAGDPFIAANARRLHTLGWAVLAWQLTGLAYGGVALWLRYLRVDFAGWDPSLAGWVVVAMIFVLARVFAHGAEMRDELEATI